MCTMIATQIKVAGSGKAGNGWFTLGEANVSYDHPFEAPFEHALSLDFVNEGVEDVRGAYLKVRAPAIVR